MTASFVGSRLGSEGQLEVLGRCPNTTKSHSTRYIVKCHICAQDPELHGNATYESLRGNLVKGKMPCGCSKTPKYSAHQWDVLLTRAAIRNNLVYLGLAEDWIGQTSHIRLSCNTCNHLYETATASNLVRDRGCPVCAIRIRGDKRASPDKTVIATFFATGIFPEGTQFRRKFHNSRVWIVNCPKCPGEQFESDRANLRVGKRPCNCSTGGGFDVKLPASVYVLRVAGTDWSFTGYGISNFLERRLVDHKRELGKVGLHIEEVSTFHMTGQQALDAENAIKRAFERYTQDVNGFRREATYAEHYQDVIDFVDEWLFTNT